MGPRGKFLFLFLLMLILPLWSCGKKAGAERPGETAFSGSPPPEELAAPVPEPAEPAPPEEPAFPYAFRLKSGPPETAVFYNGAELRAESAGAGIRVFVLENGPGVLAFRSEAYRERRVFTHEIPGLIRGGELHIKLEKEGGLLELAGEAATGKQPKSACFSPEGDRIFLPLLDDPGIDVFRLSPGGEGVPVFERRLAVPGSSAKGFVEALCDGKRRELWVSNMEEDLIHLFDLDSLEYKGSIPSGGRMPKVIARNPAGTVTAVSNWLSQTVSLFDSDTKRRLAVIPAGGTPRGMAFSPDGALLYTAIFDGPLIAVISVAEKKVARTFRLYEGEGAARHVIFHNDRLYVSDMYRGNVCILSVEGKLIASVRAGSNVNTIALAPDGKRLYVSSRGKNNPDDYTKPGPEFGTVSAFSAADLSLLDRVWGRNQPTGLALSPEGAYLAFTDFLDANLEFYRVK